MNSKFRSEKWGKGDNATSESEVSDEMILQAQKTVNKSELLHVREREENGYMGRRDRKD